MAKSWERTLSCRVKSKSKIDKRDFSCGANIVFLQGHLKLNRGIDCDVIVAEVRATSHKPDEIYGIIERLSPGTRKIELFGRPHNVNPNWVTLGNQLDGIGKLN